MTWRRQATEKRQPMPIGEVLKSWARHAGLTRRLDLAKAVEDWPDKVGPQIAAVTRAESVTPDGVLWVRVPSSAWATELSMMTPRILAKLNAGRSGRIREIRWRTGSLASPDDSLRK